MKAIVIDDEKKARTLLTTILKEYCPQIDEVYEANNLQSGVKSIQKERPDIVFLDIEMPMFSGLQILDFLDKEVLDFEIVFTTAYSEYALKAFELAAIDYLLKPLRPKKIMEAIKKVGKKQSNRRMHKHLKEVLSSFKTNQFNKIALPFSDGVHFVDLKKIICFKADSMYTHVYIEDLESILISKPLRHFQKLLENNTSFYRLHRSFLINTNQIKQYIKKEGTYLVMNNDMKVNISKEKREEFLGLMK